MQLPEQYLPVPLKPEKWEDIPGYEGMYQMSSLFRVRSFDRELFKNGKKVGFKKGRVLKIQRNSDGYSQIRCYNDGQFKNQKLHTLIAKKYHSNPHNKPEVNHINGVKYNFHPINLEWNTRSENVQHAFDTGLMKPLKRGTHYNCKLVLDTATGIFYDCIRSAAESKNIPYTVLAYRLSESCKFNNTTFIYV